MELKTIHFLAVAGFAVAVLCVPATPGFAVPTLQVDILGGTYDTTTETIVTSDKAFTVRAWLTPGNGNNEDIMELISREYLLSIAVVPKASSTFDPSSSSFLIDGDTINVTEEMEYGVPPLEDMVASADPGDLSDHGIFETFFYELSFYFNSQAEYTTVNVQYNPGAPLIAGSGSYVVEFDVNVSALSGSIGGQPIGLHFDLYDASGINKQDSEDIDVGKFAPFSHDAEYRPPPRDNSEEIPEPASLAIWGLLGAVGLVAGVRNARVKSGRMC
ncbi:MAG: hypothetical protein DCC68_06335 [Planctomycetota bacterium]|nr:MAG: hypothetical protein DCC68_06335 [Planctomycetota bacterium]